MYKLFDDLIYNDALQIIFWFLFTILATGFIIGAVNWSATFDDQQYFVLNMIYLGSLAANALILISVYRFKPKHVTVSAEVHTYLNWFIIISIFGYVGINTAILAVVLLSRLTRFFFTVCDKVSDFNPSEQLEKILKKR